MSSKVRRVPIDLRLLLLFAKQRRFRCDAAGAALGNPDFALDSLRNPNGGSGSTESPNLLWNNDKPEGRRILEAVVLCDERLYEETDRGLDGLVSILDP